MLNLRRKKEKDASHCYRKRREAFGVRKLAPAFRGAKAPASRSTAMSNVKRGWSFLLVFFSFIKGSLSFLCLPFRPVPGV
jgi:hypothetical protein